MDLKQIEHFRVAGRLEHVTKAAAALGIPQPALSRSLARLQGELGVALFAQVGRSIRLTREGSVFLRCAERVLREMRDARSEMADLARGDTGIVTLGFLRSLAPDVPQLVREFCVEAPEAQFVFRQVPANEWEERLLAGDLDICLTIAPVRHAEITWKPIASQELWLCVPTRHRLASHPSVRMSDLAHETFVAYRTGHGTRALLDRLCREASFLPKIAYEGDDATCLLAFVTAGFGAAILPRHPPWPGLANVRISDSEARRSVGVAWMPGRYSSATARSFRAFLLAKTRRRAKRASGSTR